MLNKGNDNNGKSLSGKYGNKLNGAIGGHAKDDTSYSQFTSLPAGISNGTARLVDCRFGVYSSGQNAGEFFFYAAGSVLEPTEHNGITVRGLRTTIMEPVCDTTTKAGITTSQEDHVTNILNEMRKLGADTSNISTAAQLEEMAAAIKSAQPVFRFSTRLGKATPEYPNPRTFEQWDGVRGLEDYRDSQAPSEGGDVQDRTPPTASASASLSKEEDDYDALAKAADAGDSDSMEKLAACAAKVGIDESAVENAENWADLVKLIRDAENWADLVKLIRDTESGNPDPNEDEGESVPEKGQTVKYKIPGRKKASDCQVTVVFAGKQTVNLKCLDDGKSLKGIPWGKLE